MLRIFLSLPILLIACLKDETVAGFVDPGAVYRLEEVGGAASITRATISFPESGRVVGEAPCNHYSARQTVPYPWFRVEAVVATKRSCPDLTAEGAFFEALQTMTLVEVAGAVLILSNNEGLEMVFRKD